MAVAQVVKKWQLLTHKRALEEVRLHGIAGDHNQAETTVSKLRGELDLSPRHNPQMALF